MQEPWPDLVLSTGRRTAPVARWIGQQSRGHSRLVQLGRKGGDFVDGFDLAVTCAHFRLPIHPRRIDTLAPLNAVTPDRLAEAGRRWADRFEQAKQPRVALIVGGPSALHRFDEAAARKLGDEVRRFAEAANGCVLAITSPRTGDAAAKALQQSLREPHTVHRWAPDEKENPYLGYLANADVIVVTGESESMLAEAAACGKPLYIYPLEEKPLGARQRIVEWIVSRANSRPRKAKGTVRPQQGVEYLCARLIQHGLVRPRRDLGQLHDLLVQHGYARTWGEPLTTEAQVPLDEVATVAQRVRALMGEPTLPAEPTPYRVAV